jgi:hypothetical protein
MKIKHIILKIKKIMHIILMTKSYQWEVGMVTILVRFHLHSMVKYGGIINKKPLKRLNLRGMVRFTAIVAEGEGFEPPVPVKGQRFSRPPR